LTAHFDFFFSMSKATKRHCLVRRRAMVPQVMIRRRVAPDNSCLFSAVGYLCQGAQPCMPRPPQQVWPRWADASSAFVAGRSGEALVAELRSAVAEHVGKDSDAGEATLGMDKDDYCAWIRKFSSWGGENEIVFLSAYFDVEIAVLLMQGSSSVLTYGRGERSKGRIFLLYTGQHYDPVVGAASPEAPSDAEQRVFSLGDTQVRRTAPLRRACQPTSLCSSPSLPRSLSASLTLTVSLFFSRAPPPTAGRGARGARARARERGVRRAPAPRQAANKEDAVRPPSPPRSEQGARRAREPRRRRPARGEGRGVSD